MTMSLYALALFSHVVGALLLFITLALDGLGLRGLRQATTGTQVSQWAGVTGLTRVTGPLSALAIAVPGLYMATSAWSFNGWIVAGTAGWLLVAALSAFSGARLARTVRTATEHEALPPWVRAGLRDPFLVSSWLARAGLAVGVVFTMTVMPPAAWAWLTIALPAAAGLPASLLGWRHSPDRKHGPQARPPVPAGAPRSAAEPGTDQRWGNAGVRWRALRNQ
jgi:hypothetical protein